MNNLTIVNHLSGQKHSSVQLNYGLNKTELQKTSSEGYIFSYYLQRHRHRQQRPGGLPRDEPFNFFWSINPHKSGQNCPE